MERTQQSPARILARLLLIFALLFCGAHYSLSQEPSPTLLQDIPQAAEKLRSNNIAERISVLEDLVFSKSDYDLIFIKLRFENLSAADYAFVVKSVLAADLLAADEKTRQEGCWRINFVVSHFKLKEFGKPLAAYLSKPISSSEFYGILETIEAIQAVETASVLAATAGNKDFLQRKALEVLVALRSKKALPFLIQQLRSKDSIQRYSALQSLVKVGGKEAAPQIAELLNDIDENNRYWALDAIVKLNARKVAPELWKLVNTGQREDIEAYAIAALFSFGQERATSVVVEQILKRSDVGGMTVEFLVKLKARSIIPSLIAILEGKSGNKDEVYGYLIYKLGELEAREAIPVLRKYARFECGNEDTRIMAIQTLGILRAREAVDDLSSLIDAKRGVDDNLNASSAIALAEIGERRTWRTLIDIAADPKCLYSSKLLVELNRSLDLELWQQTQEKTVSSQGIVSIKEIVQICSKETGIPIKLYFEPGKDFAKRAPLKPPLKDTNGYPYANFSGGTLNYALREIPASISDGTLPQNFTFIFDDKEIHILTVEKAIIWWRTNILKN